MNRPVKRGFTLVEVMVAGAIFLLFCAGFFSAYIVAMRAQQSSMNNYRALCLARNRIQRARTMAFTSLDLLAETNAAVDMYGNPDAAGNYFRTTIIQYLTNVTSADLAEFTVQVNYPLSHGRTSSVPLQQSTLISHPM